MSDTVNRRRFLRYMGMSLSALAFHGSANRIFASSGGESSNRPNIILLMSDDQGYGDISYYGNPIVKTPLLDKMTREGIRFTSAEQLALIDNRYKLISDDGGSTFHLFDLIDDPGETTDLAREKPYTVNRMKTVPDAWVKSCRESDAGKDYK